MTDKKNRCTCKICKKQFRSRDKFKVLCPLHNQNQSLTSNKEGV